MQERKTNDNKILEMLEARKPQKEIAAFFKVSEAAISKRVKRLMPKPEPESLRDLTDKEKSFVSAIAKGKSQTAAAMEAFDCTSRDSAKTIGYRLMQRGDIERAVSELMQEEGLTKRYRVQRLKSHVDNRDPNISLKALDQTWKLDGAYLERHVNMNIDYVDAVREYETHREEEATLMQRLKQGLIEGYKEEFPTLSMERITDMAEAELRLRLPEMPGEQELMRKIDIA